MSIIKKYRNFSFATTCILLSVLMKSNHRLIEFGTSLMLVILIDTLLHTQTAHFVFCNVSIIAMRRKTTHHHFLHIPECISTSYSCRSQWSFDIESAALPQLNRLHYPNLTIHYIGHTLRRTHLCMRSNCDTYVPDEIHFQYFKRKSLIFFKSLVLAFRTILLSTVWYNISLSSSFGFIFLRNSSGG